MKKCLAMLFFLVFFSGCVSDGVVENSLITETSVKTYNNFVKIDLSLKNTLQNSVRNVEIGFRSLDILIPKVVEKCDGEVKNFVCIFKEIEPYDEKRVVFTALLPKNYTEQRVTPTIYISYDYHSGSLLQIPIKGDEYNGEIPATYHYSTGDGPMQVFMSIDQEKNYVLSDEWFILTVKISVAGGDRIKINKNDFNLNLGRNLEVYTGESSFCDFTLGDGLKLKEDLEISSNDISLGCTLKPKNINEDVWEIGSVSAEYTYRYTKETQISLDETKR